MSKKTASRHQDRQQDQWVIAAHGNHKAAQRSGRKYLKDLDRELQRFMARVAGLESRSTYDDEHELPNLAVEAEEIYRDALVLRTEIRECFAQGNASRDDVVERIGDSWDQLCDSFEDLKSTLRQDRPARVDWMTTESDEDETLELDKIDDDLLDDDFESAHSSATVDRRIHRPRGGPKR
jgi:hypothetical protein